MDNITEIETRLAFLENTLEKLNEVIVEQADEITLLKKEIKFLKEKLSSLEDHSEAPEDKPPPHY